MRQNLSNLDELSKLKYAIECVEQSIPFPSDIHDFLIQHDLYELIINPKARYANKRNDSKSK